MERRLRLRLLSILGSFFSSFSSISSTTDLAFSSCSDIAINSILHNLRADPLKDQASIWVSYFPTSPQKMQNCCRCQLRQKVTQPRTAFLSDSSPEDLQFKFAQYLPRKSWSLVPNDRHHFNDTFNRLAEATKLGDEPCEH